MIVEIGHFALILAFGVALVQVILPFAGIYKKNASWISVAEPAAQLQFVLLGLSFLALTYAYVVSDFSVQNVFLNSHSEKPLLYKISGVWGNHEGSMLLWVLILALFGAAVALFGHNLPPELRANVLAVQASIAVAFLGFMVFTSNPFERLDVIPPEGQGLNPILQDPALAFHPPFLYVGYVGFSMAFSFAIAALIDGKIDAAWARWVRPWTLLAWIFLTIGIAMGSWWAYYELGWGGWWFWDPVENSSFMPWLAGTALLHSALVMEKREALKVWTILLAIITFSLSLMGAFLVRSGILTSVHSFAVDPERGMVILGILFFFTGSGLALFAWRAPKMKQGGVFAPISREGSLILNNVLLCIGCGTVFFGTLYPLMYQMVTGGMLSVGAPFFNMTFVPFMILLMVVLPFGPFLAWKRGDLQGAMQRLYLAAGLALLAVIITVSMTTAGPLGAFKYGVAIVGIGLGVWLIAGAMSELLMRARLGNVSAQEFFRRLTKLPRSAFGTAIAHAGLGVSVLGIVATSAWQTEQILAMKQGESVQIAGYELMFKTAGFRDGPNYKELVAEFSLRQGGVDVRFLHPSKRTYNAPPQTTSEAGIYASWAGDLYAVLGDPLPENKFAIRLYFNPLVRLIWIGAILMFIGGLISLSDRRLRVGAPRKVKTHAVPVAAE